MAGSSLSPRNSDLAFGRSVTHLLSLWQTYAVKETYLLFLGCPHFADLPGFDYSLVPICCGILEQLAQIFVFSVPPARQPLALFACSGCNRGKLDRFAWL